jgi:hypothetical protein
MDSRIPHNALTVHCSRGNDGVKKYTFLLEVYRSIAGMMEYMELLIANMVNVNIFLDCFCFATHNNREQYHQTTSFQSKYIHKCLLLSVIPAQAGIQKK